MKKKPGSQKGQALVLVAFGMVALLMLTGLAIDSGNVFSDRRHAQNAADTASLSGALAKVNDQDWQTAAMDRVDSNGYSNDGTYSTVTAVIPPSAGCNGKNGPYAGNTDYIQVIIHSTVDTFFVRILGIDQLHNCVEAIAKADLRTFVPFALGNAIAAMDCEAKYAFKILGDSVTIASGGGIFSNSNDPDGLYVGKIENLEFPDHNGITSVGGVKVPDPNPWDITEGVDQIPCPLPDYWYPGYPDETDFMDWCDITVEDFPDDVTEVDFRQTIDDEEVYVMESGKTYCITGSFKLPTKALYGERVHFVLINEGLHWNGNAELHLSAGQGEEDPLSGILIYLPKPNNDSIDFNGCADSEITGTIFAPSSPISLNGSFEGTSWEAQIIGATIDLTGGEDLEINFDAGKNGGYTDPPGIELTK